jgi:lysophospholipase L1-like esterase
MSKSLLTVLLLAVFLTLPAMPAQAAVPETRLLVLGDSISTGWGLPFQSQSFGTKLSTELFADYTNLGIDGLETSGLLTLLTTNGFAGSDSGQDIIILSIGGNDIFQPFMQTSKRALGLSPEASAVQLALAVELTPNAYSLIASELQKDMSIFEQAVEDYYINKLNILTTLRLRNPSALIYTLNHYNPFSGYGGSLNVYHIAEELMTGLNAQLERLTDVVNFGIIDIYSEFKGNTAFYTNFISFDPHPNALGHAVIFDRVFESVLLGEQSRGNGVTGVLVITGALVAWLVGTMGAFLGFIMQNPIIMLPFGMGFVYAAVRILRRVVKTV